MSDRPSYDVCLSFAGEQRSVVERVATGLRRRGIRVFYDRFDRAGLWGKDLVEHLDHVYREDSRYCVVFVSREYAAKVWTRHELRSVMARALESSSEYVLPARFDDTPIPGLLPTVAFADLRETTSDELVKLIVTKVRPVAPPTTGANPSRRLTVSITPEAEEQLAAVIPSGGTTVNDAVRRMIHMEAQLLGPGADEQILVERADGSITKVVMV